MPVIYPQNVHPSLNSLDPITPLLDQACLLLVKGELVVIPTETVYGLAADALNSLAINKIYKLKQRPPANPLILHCANYEQAQQWGHFPKDGEKLANIFWGYAPSPLTLVLRQTQRAIEYLSPLVTAGLQTVAIRVPHHPITTKLLEMYPNPLAAPSANYSTGISPTTAINVQRSFGCNTPYILEGGGCSVGIESTILDLSQGDNEDAAILLRPGATTIEMLEAVLEKTVTVYKGSSIKAPGMMQRHYAPHLPLRINCLEPNLGEAFLGFGPPPYHKPTLNLSPSGNLEEAACNLFAMLTQLDNGESYKGIAVMPIPHQGIGVAINDRLRRASQQL